jgi:hypothetical protein
MGRQHLLPLQAAVEAEQRQIDRERAGGRIAAELPVEPLRRARIGRRCANARELADYLRAAGKVTDLTYCPGSLYEQAWRARLIAAMRVDLTDATSQTQRIVSVDALRGLAMFLIIGFDGAMGRSPKCSTAKDLARARSVPFSALNSVMCLGKVFTSMMSSFRSSFSLLAFLSCFRCLRSSSVGASANARPAPVCAPLRPGPDRLWRH